MKKFKIVYNKKGITGTPCYEFYYTVDGGKEWKFEVSFNVLDVEYKGSESISVISFNAIEHIVELVEKGYKQVIGGPEEK